MQAGKVYLIGAGPGDPELMTLKAVRKLNAADVVLIDDLVNRAVLSHARIDARIIEVGKRGGCLAGAGTTFIAAMKNKAIDCGMTTEPTVSAVLGQGLAQPSIFLKAL